MSLRLRPVSCQSPRCSRRWTLILPHGRRWGSISFTARDTLRHLSDAAGRIGFLLPDFAKDALFPYVAGQGVLPRKTFSMGTALEKRYYLEARMIQSVR